MLINDSEQFVQVPFDDKTEIEGVVQRYAEQIFGSSAVYLPQPRTTPLGGQGTAPDAIAINVEFDQWYVIDAERAVRGTWEHLAPRLSRQLTAVSAVDTRETIVQLASSAIDQSAALRTTMRELGVPDLEIRARLRRVLVKPPIIAIAIDDVSRDLKEWIQTLRNPVQVWLIEKWS